MSKTIRLALNIALWSLLLVSVILIIIFLARNGKVADEMNVEAIADTLGSSVDNMLIWSYVLAGIGLVAALGFSVWQMIMFPKNAIRTLGGIGIFAVIIIVAYSLSSGEILNIPGYMGSDNNPETLKWSDTGIITMEIMLLLAFLTLLGSGIYNLIKRI